MKPIKIAGVMLYNGRIVPEVFFNNIRRLVMASVHSCRQGRVYHVARLVSRELWEKMSQHEREDAMLCLATLVMDKMVPLAFSEKKHSYYILPVRHAVDVGLIQSVIGSFFREPQV